MKEERSIISFWQTMAMLFIGAYFGAKLRYGIWSAIISTILVLSIGIVANFLINKWSRK